MINGERIEKWILRKAFEEYLPEEILWRQKEQFSDGVGYSWIDMLKAEAEKKEELSLRLKHNRLSVASLRVFLTSRFWLRIRPF